MRLRFVEKRQEAGDVWSFFFELSEPLEWIAGQSIRLEIPRKSWGYDERRFTIASAPHEKRVQITTRINVGEFKQNLASLEQNTEIDGHNVEGDFVWQDTGQHKLLLAAGIGITPYRSILSDQIISNKPINATLIYSSKDTPAVFEEELRNWSRIDDSFKILITNSRINIDSKSSLAPKWLDSLVYVSGPEQMVIDVSKHLIKAGIPNDKLKQDLFTGKFPA